MKAPENKPEWPLEEALRAQDAEAIDSLPPELRAHATPGFVPEAWHPSVWDALVGYWGYADPQRNYVPESRGRWLLDDDDFSSEHGYEPGFEGRSEFEHGEFDRWL
jgi:hypothetical protein